MVKSPENQPEIPAEKGAPVTEEELRELRDAAKKLVALLEATLLRSLPPRTEESHEEERTEDSRDKNTEESLENPMQDQQKERDQKIAIEECVQTGVRVSSLLARTMFLKGTPISASTHFLSSVKITTTLPTMLLDTMLADFPKLHQLIETMMETNQRSKNKYKFERLLEIDMGVHDVLKDIQKWLAFFVQSENVLRVSQLTIAAKQVIKILKKKKEELANLELKVEILDAIRVPREGQEDSDFVALWDGKEGMVVSPHVLENWKRGFEGFNKNQEGMMASVQGGDNDNTKTVFNWVKETPRTHKTWTELWLVLQEAVRLGCSASVLLKRFLVSLPQSHEKEMVMEQLKALLKRLAEDESNVAAHNIMKLGLFDLASQNTTGAGGGEEAHDHEMVRHFKMLLIRVNLIFRHRISFPGRFTVQENALSDSLGRYIKRSDKHVKALKLKLVVSVESWEVEYEAMRESWKPSSFGIPSRFE